MANLKLNIAANLAGNLWTVVISLIFVPVYIHLLGMESYGLIGLFTTLQAVFLVLDLGLSSALNRELARYTARSDRPQDFHDLVRTLEILYWGVALLIGATVVIAAPWISQHWLKAQALPAGTIQQAVLLMGVILLFQWPGSLYSGGLLGLQHQVLLNMVGVVIMTLRSGGVVLLLWLVSPSIQMFFVWQTAMSLLHTALLRGYLLARLPASSLPPRFRGDLLKSIWQFAAGTTGLSIEGMIVTQQDKIVVSKMLPLDVFGSYSLAAMVSGSLSRLVSPVMAAIFPRFTQLLTIEDDGKLLPLYHRSCQLLAVLVYPVAAMLACFSRPILLLWTRDEAAADAAAPLLSLMAIGVAVNISLHIPSTLMTAHGWLAPALWLNAGGVLFFLPATIWSTSVYGARAAILCWIGMNVLQMSVVPHILHARLLKGEKLRWYLRDVFTPGLVAFGLAALLKLRVHPGNHALAAIVLLAATYGVVLAATAAVASDVRKAAREEIRRLLKLSGSLVRAAPR